MNIFMLKLNSSYILKIKTLKSNLMCGLLYFVKIL